MSRTSRAVGSVVGNAGSEVVARARFAIAALRIDRRRRQQTVATVQALQARYRSPVLGRMYVWDLVERLASCVDPTDCRLLGTSQQLHVLQMLDRLERNGPVDPDLLVTVLIHDLGKLLLLVGEDPANVVGPSSAIQLPPAGSGLDAVMLQWGHAEFAYQRFKNFVPDHVGWLIRYHNAELDDCASAMDARDHDYAARYLKRFRRLDRDTKSVAHLPDARIDAYRDLIEKRFPDQILF